MAIKHLVTDYDTVHSISFKYYGDTTHVNEIIEYNNLVSPYLSTNNDDRYLCYARGFVLVERQITNQSLRVKKNWTFKTKPNIISSIRKTYVVTEDVVLAEGVRSAYIPVRSLVSGLQGNTLAESVQVLGDEFKRNFVTFQHVSNPKPIRGGTEGKVLTTGEYLFIPINADESRTADDGYNRARYYFGDDLRLSTESDLMVTESGDLDTVSFIDNIAQSIRERLKSERGANESDFDGGNDLYTLIGNAQIPYYILPNRIEVEILRVLSNEDRIKDTKVTDIRLNTATKSAEIDIQTTVIELDEVLDITQIAIGGNRNV